MAIAQLLGRRVLPRIDEQSRAIPTREDFLLTTQRTESRRQVTSERVLDLMRQRAPSLSMCHAWSKQDQTLPVEVLAAMSARKSALLDLEPQGFRVLPWAVVQSQ